EAVNKQIAQDAGNRKPGPPADQRFEMYRRIEFADGDTPALIGLTASDKRGKDMIVAFFAGGKEPSFASCRQLMGEDVPEGQVVEVSGSGQHELVEHDSFRLHGLSIFELAGPVHCALKESSGIEQLQSEPAPVAGEVQSHISDLDVYILRNLEFSVNGKTAKMIGRNSGMNSLDTLIVNFKNADDPAFAKCRPMF